MHNEKLIKGLYDYREEHDACGIGFYANMDNKRSHDIIDKSLEMLRRLDHSVRFRIVFYELITQNNCI